MENGGVCSVRFIVRGCDELCEEGRRREGAQNERILCCPACFIFIFSNNKRHSTEVERLNGEIGVIRGDRQLGNVSSRVSSGRNRQMWSNIVNCC